MSVALLLVTSVLLSAAAGCVAPEVTAPGATDGDGPPGAPGPVAPAAPRFAEVAVDAGVAGCGAQTAEEDARNGHGPGAAWGDYDHDGDPDLYAACRGDNRLYRNNGNGTFTDVADAAGVRLSGTNSSGVAWADYDGDGCLDLYVANFGRGLDLNATGGRNALFHNNCDGTFEDVTGGAGVGGAEHSTGVAWADYDLDGDLDLYVANHGVATEDLRVKSEKNRLYRNDGNGTFTDVAERAGVAGVAMGPEEVDFSAKLTGLSSGALWLDYNNDGYPDLFSADAFGVSPLYKSRGDGTFEAVTNEAGLWRYGSARGVDGGDYDLDGDVDIYVTNVDENHLWRNNGDGTFTEAAAPAGMGDAFAGRGAAFEDFDNDGWEDLFLVHGATGRRPLEAPNVLFLNGGDGTFRDVTNASGLRNTSTAVGLALADYDLDGDVDAYVTDDNARNLLYRNDGPAGSWLRLRLQANQSAPHGVGAQVWVVDGEDLWLREVRAGSGFLGADEVVAHFGLGDRREVDLVEVRWPSGNRQVLKAVALNRTLVVEERNTEKTSCPLLFAVAPDGSVRFVGDVLGNAYSGWLVAPNTYHKPDPTELVRIGSLQPVDGAYELRLLEALEETNFLDMVQLVAVDHPAHVTVYPDERFKTLEPYPDFGLVASRDARPVAGAWTGDGRDVTPLVTERDRRYPGVPAMPPPKYDGYAEPHAFTFDLGAGVVGAERVQLLIHGWVYYPMVIPDLIGAGTPLPVEPPRLEALDPATGEWVLVAEDMGFPAGLPKTMTYDLTGKLPEDARLVRVTSNLRVYYDEVRVDTTPVDADLRVTRAAPDMATLGFGGYPAFELPDGREPGVYNYSRRADVHVWDEIHGNYTRFGDVAPLLQGVDDKFVIFGHGDEVVVRFAADRFPPLAEGWTRTFFMYGDAFFKDTEPFNAFPRTVEPLPFHGMGNYPPAPGEAYPDDGEHREYLRTYNTRVR